MKNVNNIDEFDFIEKILYISQFIEKNDINHNFYLYDFVYEDIEKSNDKEKLLSVIGKILEKLTESYNSSYDEYKKILNMDIELELLPMLENNN